MRATHRDETVTLLRRAWSAHARRRKVSAGSSGEVRISWAAASVLGIWAITMGLMAMFVAAFDAPLLILAACSLVLAAGGVLLAIATSRLPDDERAW